MITDEDLLDAASAAREVAMFTALTLLASDTPEEAIAVCEHLGSLSPAEGDELDCATLSAQAIRDALAAKAGG